ncbi:hypothetical protein IF1G_02029 [Cordyceps javanica]|uniref:Uncharacterized protein n=1 Tax=Cordyceps javanica TaxID=43265 RepID=A0A545VDN3_9HYPO|nr:hypothetical protein IF1G_02029 [Cordyceps javanica]
MAVYYVWSDVMQTMNDIKRANKDGGSILLQAPEQVERERKRKDELRIDPQVQITYRLPKYTIQYSSTYILICTE